MGLLDPKIDKERTFELLRKKDAIRAVLEFEGGHDEGAVEKIVLTLETGEEIELPTWYCGGYRYQEGGENGGWVPVSQPANEDEELADLLEGPINREFGSWGDVPMTRGTLIWDVFTGKAHMTYDQERYVTVTSDTDVLT